MNPNSIIAEINSNNLVSQINYLLEQINGSDSILLSQNYSQEEIIKLDPSTENLVVVKTKKASDGSFDYKLFVQNNNNTSSLGEILIYIKNAGSNYLGAEIITPYQILYLSKEDIMNNLVVAIKALTEGNNNFAVSSDKLVATLSNVLVSGEITAAEINECVEELTNPKRQQLKNEILGLLKQKAQVSEHYFRSNSAALNTLQGLINNDSIKTNPHSTEPADIFEAEVRRWPRDMLKAYSLGFIGPYNHLLAVDTYKKQRFDVEPFNKLLKLADEVTFTKDEFQEHFRTCTDGGLIRVSENERFKKLFQLIALLAEQDIKERGIELAEIIKSLKDVDTLETTDAIRLRKEHYMKQYGTMKRITSSMQNSLNATSDLKELAHQIGGEIAPEASIRKEFVKKFMQVVEGEKKSKVLNSSASRIYSTLVDSYPENKIRVHGIGVANSNELKIQAVIDADTNFSLRFDAASSLITPMQQAFDDQISQRIAQIIEFKGLENRGNTNSLGYYLRQCLYIDTPKLSQQHADVIIKTLLNALQLKHIQLETTDLELRNYQVDYLWSLAEILGQYIYMPPADSRIVTIASLYKKHIQNIISVGSRDELVVDRRGELLMKSLIFDIDFRLKEHIGRIEKSNFYVTFLGASAVENELLYASDKGVPLFELHKFLLPVFSHQAEWADPTVASCYQAIADYNQKVMNQFHADLVAIIGIADTPEAKKIIDDLLMHALKSFSPLPDFFHTAHPKVYHESTYAAVKKFFSNEDNKGKRLSKKIEFAVPFQQVLGTMYREALLHDVENPNYWIKYNSQRLKIPIFNATEIFSSDNFTAVQTSNYLQPSVKIFYIRNTPLLLAKQGSIANRGGRIPLMAAIWGEKMNMLNGNKYKLTPPKNMVPSGRDMYRNPAAYFMDGPVISKIIRDTPENLLNQKINILDNTYTLTNIDGMLQDRGKYDNVYYASTADTGLVMSGIKSFIKNTVQYSDRDLLFSFNSLHGYKGISEIVVALTEQQKAEGVKQLKIRIGSSKDANYPDPDHVETVYMKDIFELILTELYNKPDFTARIRKEPFRVRFHFGSCLVGAQSEGYNNWVGLLNGLLPNDSFIEKVADNLMEVLKKHKQFREAFKYVNFEVIGAMAGNMAGIFTGQMVAEISEPNALTGNVNELAQALVKTENGVLIRQYQRIPNPNENENNFRAYLNESHGGSRIYAPKSLVRPSSAPISIPRVGSSMHAREHVAAPIGFRPIHWN